MAERRAQAGRAYHYRDTGSSLHRLGAGWKLAAVGVAAAAAAGPGGAWPALTIVAGVAAGYALARLSAAELWQDARWLVGLLLVLAIIGFVFTLRLKYGEFVVLHTFCPWCAISAVAITIITILAVLEWRGVARKAAA